ncbi:MAG: class I SAM-dependent methyltransferase [Alphaproteobacteria bacterium]
MAEVDLLRRYPRARRNIAARKAAQAASRARARQFGFEYFDGSREEGYGGYRYDGRWVPIAADIVAHFGLKPGDRVLDVGCAKAFLVADLAAACPGLDVYGLDISHYALSHAHPGTEGRLVRGSAARLPFADGAFAAVLAINVIHNLPHDACVAAVREIERLAPGRGFIQVDAYRSAAERAVFLDWVLTAETHGTPEFWRDLFAQAGYTGDYHWTILDTDPAWSVTGDAG